MQAHSVENIHVAESKHLQEETRQETKVASEGKCGKELRKKWLQTLLLVLGYMGIGMTYTVPGPSLIDLEIRTGSTTKQITFMFTLRAVGGLLASLSSGPLFDIINADLIMGVGYAFASVFIIIAPWWTNLMAMCVSVGIAGFFSGAMNVGVHYCCIGIWGKRNPPFLLMLSFMNLMADAAIPPIVKLLLLPMAPPSDFHKNISNQTKFNLTLPDEVHKELFLTNTPGNRSGRISPYGPDDVKVQYAFLVPGTAFAICGVIHLLLFFSSGCSRASSYTSKIQSVDHECEAKSKAVQLFPGSCAYTVLLLTMFAVITSSQAMLEETCHMFLFSYVVKYLGWSKDDAAIINMIFILTCTLSLIPFMVISRFIHPNFTVLILVNTILLPCVVLSVHVNRWLVWVGFAAIAVGLGPLSPTIVSWMSGCFPMKGKLTAFYFVTFFGSRLIATVTVGHVFEAWGLGCFVYINVIIITAGVLATTMANIFTKVPFCKTRLPSGMEEIQAIDGGEPCKEANMGEDTERSDMLRKRS